MMTSSIWTYHVLEYSNPTSVPSPSHHDNIPNIKLDEFSNLVVLQVKFDGVIGLDEWVWVTNGTTIIGIQVWNALLSKLY